MPRSRSRSIESRTCACISRIASDPVSSSSRSASVDFPWSICAIIAKLRMREASIEVLRFYRRDTRGADTPVRETIGQTSNHIGTAPALGLSRAAKRDQLGWAKPLAWSIVINMLDHDPVRMQGVQRLIERRHATREHDTLPSRTDQDRHREKLPSNRTFVVPCLRGQ